MTFHPSEPDPSAGERRRRGSGQITTKPCPACGASLVIDSRLIVTDRAGQHQSCAACGTSVPLRVADRYRAPLAQVLPLVPSGPSRKRRRRSPLTSS